MGWVVKWDSEGIAEYEYFTHIIFLGMEGQLIDYENNVVKLY